MIVAAGQIKLHTGVGVALPVGLAQIGKRLAAVGPGTIALEIAAAQRARCARHIVDHCGLTQ